MNPHDRARRIADATGYRLNHIRRILKAIDPPHRALVQTVVEQFRIPEGKATLIVRMAREEVEPQEDMRSGISNLYVILLDKAVLQRPKFRKMNPGYRHRRRRPCVYVGVSAHPPRDRFRQHKAGIKHSRTVKKYGKRLMPRLYKRLNPVPSGEAKDRERALAEALRRKGYGVWQF